jgi:hypothetical protein
MLSGGRAGGSHRKGPKATKNTKKNRLQEEQFV